MGGTIMGDIPMVTTGDLTGGITPVITTDMCGMTPGIIPTSTIITPGGIMVIIMLTILTLAQVNLVGVEEVLRHSPIIVPRLQPLRVVNQCLVPHRVRQVRHARAFLQVV